MPASRDASLLALFDDLEQQAAGLALEDRAAEVASLAQAQFAEVTLTDRLLAAAGSPLVLRVRGELVLRGELLRSGVGWALLRDAAEQVWLVPTTAVLSVAGLSPRAVAPAARTVLGRLGLGAALRGIAADRDEVVVHLVDGTRLEGSLDRVGADFVEVHGATTVLAVPVAAIGAVQARR